MNRDVDVQQIKQEKLINQSSRDPTASQDPDPAGKAASGQSQELAALLRSATTVQRRAGGAEAAATAGQIRKTAALGVVGEGVRLPHLDRIQASFGAAHDLSQVNAHVGGAAAAASRAIGAEAYATGNQVAFGRQPDLHTAAHEAAHVVQQKGGVQLSGGVGTEGDANERHADAVADRVVQGRSSEDLFARFSGDGSGSPAVQMRRLPPNVRSLLTDPTNPNPNTPAPNFPASLEGIVRLLERSLVQLDPSERTAVGTVMLEGLDWAVFLSLPIHEIYTRVSDAILSVRPDLTLGDPNLIDTGPRTGTNDEANMQKLVENAKRIFNAIIGGRHNRSLDDVFGRRHRNTAKAKYARARYWMRRLDRQDRVVTDRSGYNREVELGGLTGFQDLISLAPSVIDNPDVPESIIIMIHEAMHAGNADVHDNGYIEQPFFTERSAADKLANAAHYEVVPRRSLNMSFAFTGVTFVPAGTTVGGVTRPALTATQQSIRGASEAFRDAWTIGLNLHSFFVDACCNPTSWTTNRGSGRSYAGSLPYWSKVEKLTIHRKTDIDPASPNPAKHAVSQIDVALSEGLTRKMAIAMSQVPGNEAAATAFETANSTDAERTAAHASVTSHKEFLIGLVLKQPGVAPITGPVERDRRVVREFVTLNFATVLDNRNPDDFAD